MSHAGHHLPNLGITLHGRNVTALSLLGASAPSTESSDRFKAIGPQHLDDLQRRFGLSSDMVDGMRLHAAVLPFRVNEYVIENLIDWSNIPEDPIFQLVFPQPGMLPDLTTAQLELLRSGGRASRERIELVARLRAELNPHPAGQQEHNVPMLDGQSIDGVQHKYEQTALYFPAQGQTCHAYCTYCFRWAQFIGDPDLRFAAKTPEQFVGYLHAHPEVHDVLVTGGDSMIMSTERLRSHIHALMGVETVRTFRFGTKALAYWPDRFVNDTDADDLLLMFEEIIASGCMVAVMAHFSHPRELSTPLVQEAMRRIRATGAVIYCQAPLMAHVNDDAQTWADMWRAEVSAGAVPYYMFMARDTGPQDYFEVPIPRAYEIFTEAYRTLPGLSRTVRGPVMSSGPGKVMIDGISGEPGSLIAHARFLQARDPELVGRPFRAACPDDASWLDDLTVLDGEPADITAEIARFC